MDNANLSLKLYHYLCNVIGSVDVVAMRRRIYNTVDHGKCLGNATSISSGSKAEGLDLNGSDFDTMMLFNDLPVYETNDAVNIHSKTFPLVMNTTECKPGVTLLQRHYSQGLNDFTCEYKPGVSYLSSRKYRNHFLPGIDSISHGPRGPCISTRDGTFDVALCFRCQHWISSAHPWIFRSRNSWASPNVISAILQFGVLFVPIGSKNSPNTDLEWRISFSYAEKLLICSFNHVQLLCYALLKILLKDILKNYTGDLLCSYFLKTVMLWLCEETESSQWKPSSLTSCFMSCLNRLYYFVYHKMCFHYFIPENNLFADRFNEEDQKLLLSILTELRSFGWTCLLQTTTLGTFREFLAEPNSIQKVSYLPCLNDMEQFYFSQERLEQCVYAFLRSTKRDLYIYMISLINKRISQSLRKGDNNRNGNKQLYHVYRKQLCHLLIGLNDDAVSGWLLCASFFYVNKQYNLCKFILSYCLSKCTPEKFLLAKHISNDIQIRLNFFQRDLRFRHLRFLKTYVIKDIAFTRSSTIIPLEMQFNEGNGEYTFAPPVVFGWMLTFLCNHHLGNQREKNESWLILNTVINKKYFIDKDSFFEMLLSYC